MKALRLTVMRYKQSDTSHFVVDGLRFNGKRVRRFFTTRQQADTFAAQTQIQLGNLVPPALWKCRTVRVMAIDWAEKLKPFGNTLGPVFTKYRSSWLCWHSLACPR